MAAAARRRAAPLIGNHPRELSKPVEHRIVDAPAMLLAGIRREHQFTDASRNIPAQWSEFGAMLPIADAVPGVTYGAMCATYPERQAFEYMTATAVTSFDALPPQLGRMRVPAARYLVFASDGPSSSVQLTWTKIHQWLPTCGHALAHSPDFERYDERLWKIAERSGPYEIWIPIVA